MKKVTPSPELADSRLLPMQTRTPNAKTLIAFSALIMLLFCVFVAYQASKAYEVAIEDAKQNASRLTRILSDQVELTLMGADLVINRATERQYFNTMFGGNLPRDIENNFRLWVDETPQVAALMLVDAEGVIKVAANKRGYDRWYDYGRSVANDPAFLAMREEGDHPVYIGAVTTPNPEHPQMILLSRRVNNVDGSFGGVIIAALDPAYFSNFFASIDQGKFRFMALMLNDGSLLYGGPGTDKSRDAVLLFVGNHCRAHSKTGEIVTDTKNFNDSIKIFSYGRLKSMPVTASVIVDEQDFLHEWREARSKDISFVVIFIMFGSVLSFFALSMAQQVARVEKSEAAAILASQAKSEFLANMSHELRTPLNAVIGFSEMLGAGYFGPLNDKQRERVQDIRLCGGHLLQLITDILDFSKGEAGKLELYEEEIDVARSVNEALRIVNERAMAKHIRLNAEIAEHLPTLMADRRKVRQILLNLLSNALKFTPAHGQITVSVRIDHHRQMQLVVSDTGIGIAEADIPQALAVFGQVHRSHSHEGTGLGLPLCKMFAELHGGKLQLTSQVGVGTTVRVTFPESRVKYS